MTIQQTIDTFERCKECVIHTDVCNKECNRCDYSELPYRLLDAYNTAIGYLKVAKLRKGFEE